jgi:ChrR Cupin-like domain
LFLESARLLRGTLSGRADRIRVAIAAEAPELPGTTAVRADEGKLAADRHGGGAENPLPDGRRRHLTDLRQPGARLPGHEHDDDEEMYVLAGDLSIGTLTLHAGDYHLARRGVQHPTATTAEGCLILVSAAA